MKIMDKKNRSLKIGLVLSDGRKLCLSARV